MAEFIVTIFAADNIINPQNPGFLPAEDRTFASDLRTGEQITWVGGGESAQITIIDNQDTVFSEAQSNQTLQSGLTFNGTSYNAGQVVTPSYNIVFNGSDGETYFMTSYVFSGNTDNQVPDAVLWLNGVPPNGTILTVASESNPTGSNAPEYANIVTCFCKGTYIQTPSGPTLVEGLKKGDLVCTQDGNSARIHHVYRREISSVELKKNPKLKPVKISAGSLGLGLPTHDLWVSRQHRMLISSSIAFHMFGVNDVLIPAIKLTQLPGIDIDTHITKVEYFHVLLADHEIIFAEGAPTESLYLGEETLKSMTPDGQKEITTIFPELADPLSTFISTHYIPTGTLQKKLIKRHAKYKKPLIESTNIILRP